MAYKYSHKIKFRVNLISLYTWKDAGFSTPSTELPSDIDFYVDTLDMFKWPPNAPKEGFLSFSEVVRREFADDMPDDIVNRISIAVQRRAEDDLNEVRRYLGFLNRIPCPAGCDRAAWNIYNQSGNHFSNDATYRMIFTLDKTDNKLGIVIGTPTFFRDNIIVSGDINPNLDIHSEPLNRYYQEL